MKMLLFIWKERERESNSITESTTKIAKTNYIKFDTG